MPMPFSHILAKGLRYGGFAGLAITAYALATGNHQLISTSYSSQEKDVDSLGYAALKDRYNQAVASIEDWPAELKDEILNKKP